MTDEKNAKYSITQSRYLRINDQSRLYTGSNEPCRHCGCCRAIRTTEEARG